MKIVIDVKDSAKLNKKEIDFMNTQRVKLWGKGASVDFKKEDPMGKFFIVRENHKIVAFGMLKPVLVELDGEKYKILGMGRGLAVKRGIGYGSILAAVRLQYCRRYGKTCVAFISRSNLKFFEKSGFKIKKNFIKRFRYRNPRTGEIVIDNDGDVVYYEGKDSLISKMISSKGFGYTNRDFW